MSRTKNLLESTLTLIETVLCPGGMCSCFLRALSFDLPAEKCQRTLCWRLTSCGSTLLLSVSNQFGAVTECFGVALKVAWRRKRSAGTRRKKHPSRACQVLCKASLIFGPEKGIQFRVLTRGLHSVSRRIQVALSVEATPHAPRVCWVSKTVAFQAFGTFLLNETGRMPVRCRWAHASCFGKSEADT